MKEPKASIVGSPDVGMEVSYVNHHRVKIFPAMKQDAAKESDRASTTDKSTKQVRTDQSTSTLQ